MKTGIYNTSAYECQYVIVNISSAFTQEDMQYMPDVSDPNIYQNSSLDDIS